MADQVTMSYCTRTVRADDRDRFLCAMFAPPRHREALFALYAFNLEIARVRETVTEPLIGRMRLQWWRDAIGLIRQGDVPKHPVAEALAETLGAYDVSVPLLERLIDGRERDMLDEPPADTAALLAYAEETSAPLVRLSLQVLGGDGDAAAAAARDVGIAWALVGLMRAVPFHAAAHRTYLPQDACRRAGLAVTDFARGPAPPGLRAVIEDIADAARDALRSARAHRRAVPKRAVPALLPATLAEHYLGLLRRARYDPFDPRTQRPRPSGILRLMVNGFRGSY